MGVLSASFLTGTSNDFLSTVVRSSSQAAETASAAGHGSKISGSDVVLMLLTLSVIVRIINFHWFQLPSSVAMALGSIFCTGGLVVLSLFPFLGVHSALENFRDFLKDFPDLVLHYMLGFLLFAAALEVKKQMLERIWTTVIALSVFSTAISTLIVSVLTYLLMQCISEMDFAYCLLFGAIVSPTDPVTVISIVNQKKDLLPKSTEYFVLGESLLNDAVGVVLYLVFSEIVAKPDIRSAEVLQLLLQKVVLECIGGAVIGVALAWLAYSAIKSVDDPLLEVMITFVLVGNINFICRLCHASIPLASVFAGLFVGNYGAQFAMSHENVEMFREIWKLADETLNSVLFLMIGAAELFWNPQDLGFMRCIILVVSVICISIFARAISVALPLFAIIFIEWLTGRRLRHPAVKYRGGTLAVLTWAGMRGGISIALALGIPDAFVVHAVPGHMTNGQLIFFMTFTLVVFSIIIQGLYFEHVVRAIRRVSYRIMPSIGTSGGLGTFVSTMDLHQEPGMSADEEDGDLLLTPDLYDESGDFDRAGSWAHGGDSLSVGESNGMPPLLPREISALGDSDAAPYSSSGAINAPQSLIEHQLANPMEPRVVSALPYHMRTRGERTQGSATFANLRGLQEPITINAFLSESSKTISSFITGRPKNQPNFALRRSKTEPNHNLLSQMHDPTASQDDLATTLSSALRGTPMRSALRQHRPRKP